MECIVCETAAKVVVLENHCELIIHDKAHKEIARAKFSHRHRELVAWLRWNLRGHGYPRNHRRLKYLHQVLMGEREGMEVDHINGDRLDNRDENMRFATHAENGRNLKLSKRNKSGKKGVWFDKKTKSWQVRLCYLGKQLFFGRYTDYLEACRVRDDAEAKYYGDHARRSLLYN